MLGFLGLNKTRTEKVLQEYNEKYGHDPASLMDLETYPNGRQGYEFPLLKRLNGLYQGRDSGDAFDYEDGYGQCGIVPQLVQL
jgi:hypothetical protein